jgi:proton-translocating NADH-quinone oxidoreductase chain M
MVNPVLLIVIPLGLAFITPLFGFISKKTLKYIPFVALLSNLIICLKLFPRVLEQTVRVSIGGFPPPLGINLVAGPLGILFATLIALVGFLVAIYAFSYIKEGAQEKYHILYLLFLTAATGVVLTGDIFNLFVFFEILCISSYSLVAYFGDKSSIESAVKYLIQGALGSAFILIGIGLLYGRYGTLNIADIAGSIQSVNHISAFMPLFFMITGFGVEAAIFPLNGWLPDAHSSAPSSISAVLSGIAIEVGLYAMLRVLFTLFGASDMLSLFLLFGVLTLLIGELCAFSQDNIKRMLAYSSIGQIGLILFAVSIGSPEGITGGLFQLVGHTLGKALLFLSAGYMIYKTGSMDISSFEGMGKKMPWTSFAFTIGALSLVGLPPFMGFPGKFMIIKAALIEQQVLLNVLIALVLLATIIEAAYFLRVVQVIYFKGEYKTINQSRKITPLSVLIPIITLAVLIILAGIYPKLLTDILEPSASELLNRVNYIKSIIP